MKKVVMHKTRSEQPPDFSLTNFFKKRNTLCNSPSLRMPSFEEGIKSSPRRDFFRLFQKMNRLGRKIFTLFNLLNWHCFKELTNRLIGGRIIKKQLLLKRSHRNLGCNGAFCLSEFCFLSAIPYE